MTPIHLLYYNTPYQTCFAWEKNYIGKEFVLPKIQKNALKDKTSRMHLNKCQHADFAEFLMVFINLQFPKDTEHVCQTTILIVLISQRYCVCGA